MTPGRRRAIFRGVLRVSASPMTARRPAITRVDIAPAEAICLRAASQIVVHRLQTIRRDKVSYVIGHADEATMLTVTRALAVFLGLA